MKVERCKMTSESVHERMLAREKLGLILRRFRQDFPLRTGEGKNQLSRKRLGDNIGLDKFVIICIEHGNSNPRRQDFEKIISYLEIPEDDLREVNTLLNTFSSPRKWKRRGYRAPFFKLQQKRSIYRFH